MTVDFDPAIASVTGANDSYLVSVIGGGVSGTGVIVVHGQEIAPGHVETLTGIADDP